MRVLLINGGAKTSAWNICKEIIFALQKRNDEVFVATPDDKPSDINVNYFKIEKKVTRFFNKFITKIDGSDGFRNRLSTKKFIKYIDKVRPDLVHIHTIHGYFLNVKLLLDYLKNKNIPIVITCHDCWWFTGRCAYFTANNCCKWKTGCECCKYPRSYPKTIFFDKSRKYFTLKQKLISKNNVTITCVSNWLSSLAKQSPIFKEKEIKTIYNGVDSNVFYLSKDKKLNDSPKFIAVANQWSESKGLPILLQLMNYFKNIDFTIVGRINKEINFPKNVTKISYVKSFADLANLYRSHDVFINCSKQETFSLVNIESQLCGTPVICLDKTGMEETTAPHGSIAIKTYTFDAFKEAINNWLSIRTKINPIQIRDFAIKFSIKKMTNSYIDVYDKLLNYKFNV